MSCVCPRDEAHGPHDDRARFCSICGAGLEVVEVARRYHCGSYYGPPRPPESEPAECGWEGAIKLADDETHSTCPKCGADLGPDDLMALPAVALVHWPSGPVACCEFHAAGLIQLGKFMGSHVVATGLLEPAECVNCVNEGRPE